MVTLSTSRLAKFRACPRKYQFEYVQGRVPVLKARPLQLGLAWHGAMEVYWKQGREASIQWLISQAENLDEIDTARLVALLRHYNPPTSLYRVISVEEEFVGRIGSNGAPVLRGLRFGGRRDLVVERVDTGRRWLVEHKTTSDVIIGWGDYWRRLNLDSQTSNYLNYGEFEGVLYDVVRKPGLRPSRVDETEAFRTGKPVVDAFLERVSAEVVSAPDEYFQFREIRKTPADLADAQADLYDYARNLRDSHRMNRFPRNTDACRGLYGTCPYIEVCSGTARLDDDALFETRAAL